MSPPTQDQIVAQIRLVIPALGTIATAFGISAASANSYEQMILVSAGPIAYGITVIWSLYANTQASKIASVKAIATGPAGIVAVEAQKALIDATSAVAQDSSIPKSTEAKAALLDAVAAQPEVVGKIAVTDQDVVNATMSPQIQKVAP